ncbi:hypothetical protein MFLO_06034 [Listeria floridensis FSL S10-1187]|uniref:Lipoprotein n=1 Tax=Listeria floridensis FSL S10-1187 TaxID=1265817 RepID=A0ABP3B037_9LIST|nr:hypothetical protein [Listeria floridensis]EUJ32828.1 hypothetical protein MFLO_06034 [Listeria floridensis FSL S10-1187]
MVVLAFSLAACSSGAKDDSSKKEDTKTSTSSSKEKVLNYYMDVVSQISDKNADFSAFQQAQSADPKPTDAELSELAKKGTVSAQAVSDMLKDEKVPDLGKSTDKFKTAISDLSAAYGQEAEALKAAKPDTAAADEALQKAADEIAKILKDNGLAGSDILTDTM